VAAIRLDPASGPRGTQISVAGRGWNPGTTVSVRYGALGGSSATATADARGRFVATLTANGALPGSYQVTATDSAQSASATYQQTT
jgi:hypothetical protein